MAATDPKTIDAKEEARSVLAESLTELVRSPGWAYVVAKIRDRVLQGRRFLLGSTDEPDAFQRGRAKGELQGLAWLTRELYANTLDKEVPPWVREILG